MKPVHVLEVTDLRMVTLRSLPPQLSITASGTVPTGGWTNPQLVPYTYIQAPPDGIYDFNFVAQAPEGIVTQVITPIEANYRWRAFPGDLRGIRVHAANNSIVKMLDPESDSSNTPAPLEPNLFELQGYDTQITYSSSSIAGVPQFTYSDRLESRTFSGDEIKLETTALGQMVTVQLKNNQADEGFESVTLLIPKIQLNGETQELTMQTIALLNKQIVFVHPATVSQLQHYDTIHLSGTARFVFFLR